MSRSVCIAPLLALCFCICAAPLPYVPVCYQPKETGSCKALTPRWFYDYKTRQCRQFLYRGCDGNQNNFETKADCEAKCKPNVCEFEPDPGPCEAAMLRWFYNPATDKCETFIYGGCLGNENNFETLLECHAACHPDCKLGLCDRCVKEGKECVNPEALPEDYGQPEVRSCCKGLQCCACGPPVEIEPPPKKGVCREICSCPKG